MNKIYRRYRLLKPRKLRYG